MLSLLRHSAVTFSICRAVRYADMQWLLFFLLHIKLDSIHLEMVPALSPFSSIRTRKNTLTKQTYKYFC